MLKPDADLLINVELRALENHLRALAYEIDLLPDDVDIKLALADRLASVIATLRAVINFHMNH